MSDLRGKPVADHIVEKAKADIAKLKEQGINPKLAVIRVGARPDDLAYERGILKRFGEIQSFDYWGQGGTFWGEFWLDDTIADGKLFVPEKIYINFDSKIILDWRYEPDDPYSAPSDSHWIFPKQAP